MARTGPWGLRDVVLVGVAAAVFAVAYLGAVYLGIAIGTIVAPLGLAPLANEPIFGIWFMAATFMAFVLRKPGAAVLTEVLAALIEVLLGNMYGPLVLVSGALQGLGAEAVFFLYGYRNFSLGAMALAAMAAGAMSLAWGIFRSGLLLLPGWMLLTIVVIRLISSAIFAGFLSRRLALAFMKIGAFADLSAGPGRGDR
jgi:energy-coupling factor transport system substrate-specific component